MASKLTAEEMAKFQKEAMQMSMTSESDMEDSFYQIEKKRREVEISNIQKDWSVLEALTKNIKEEDEMMTQFQNQRQELHKITSNEEKNVIDTHTITEIKNKVASCNNTSHLVLADQRINESVVQNVDRHGDMGGNKSFFKVKVKAIQAEEALLLEKLEMASQEREHLAMEQEDKLSYKYQMECLSQLFKERFVRPRFTEVMEQDFTIKIAFGKLPSSKISRTPQIISDETVLPKNAPEIALNFLRKNKRKCLKPSSKIEVKVNPKQLKRQCQEFEEITSDKILKSTKNSSIEGVFKDYLSGIKSFVRELQTIADQYHPKFLRYLDEKEKIFNYEGDDCSQKERNISQTISLQNAGELCELKLSLQKLTSLSGIQHFTNIEEAQLQWNLLSSVQPLQKCKKLIQLNISRNKIRNISSLNKLSWLRLLNVEYNQLRELKPECPSLEALIASNNKIEEVELSGLSQLRLLQLQNNRINDLPEMKLLGLEELNLSQNRLSNVRGLQKLILLKKLNLSKNLLSHIQFLTFLFLNELDLSENTLRQIDNLFLPCLQELRINNNKLTCKGKGFAFLPNLKQFNIDENRLEGFGCIWWFLRFAKGAEIIRYGNNQYFLSLRQKIRQVYQSLLYKEFKSLKILNDAPADSGMAEYYRQNYSIYFDGSTFFRESDPSLTKIQGIIRLLLRQSTFSRTLESKADPFSREQAYIDYQWKRKVASLKQVISLSQNNEKPLLMPATLFHKYDVHQLARRKLYHLLRGVVLKRSLRQRRKMKYFQKMRPTIIELLERLAFLHICSEKKKSVGKFKMLTKGLNQTQAAIKIQKVWRGYIRRKLYRKLRNKNVSEDSDFEDVDIDFFDKELQRVEFDVDLQGFEDIIIRPEVFDIIQAKQQKAEKAHKEKENIGKKRKEEESGPMVNNFLDSRTKLNNNSQRREEEKINQAEKIMKEWRIKDPRVAKALQYKQAKKDKMKREEMEKNLTATERYERFKRGQ